MPLCCWFALSPLPQGAWNEKASSSLEHLWAPFNTKRKLAVGISPALCATNSAY